MRLAAYGRLFMAAVRLSSLGAPLTMPLRIMLWYCAFMGLFIIMRWLRWSFCIWARFCGRVSGPPDARE
jgi:hypothetical protein